MRIANKSIYDSIRTRLNSITEDMANANMVISSMKKINKLSDDPVGLVSILGLRASLDNIHQIERNITVGRSWLEMGESALSQVEDLLVQAKEISLEMSSANRGASDRASAATLVDGILRQVMSLANTQVDGRYIFSGTNTDTASFAFDDENNPTLATYSGNTTAFSIKIGKNTNLEVGRDGSAIFGSAWDNSNIFKTLMDLKTDLQSDNPPGVQDAMGKLDSHFDTVSASISDTGIKINRLDVKVSVIADLDLTYTDRMSKIEDADAAEAILDLKAKEMVYQAALLSAAKVMNLSLVDYI